MPSAKPLVAFRDVMLTAHELLVDFEPLHSSFQIDQFIILSNGLTVYGCYMQALREIACRVATLVEVTTPAESLRFKESKSKEVDSWGNFDFEQSRVNALWKELIQLIERAVSFKKVLGCLTPERRAKLERELWFHRAKRAVAIDFLTDGRLTRSTLELIWAIPIEDRSDLLKAISEQRSQSELINWFLCHEGLKQFDRPLGISE